jgi:hypothetical protein
MPRLQQTPEHSENHSSNQRESEDVRTYFRAWGYDIEVAQQCKCSRVIVENENASQCLRSAAGIGGNTIAKIRPAGQCTVDSSSCYFSQAKIDISQDANYFRRLVSGFAPTMQRSVRGMSLEFGLYQTPIKSTTTERAAAP